MNRLARGPRTYGMATITLARTSLEQKWTHGRLVEGVAYSVAAVLFVCDLERASKFVFSAEVAQVRAP